MHRKETDRAFSWPLHSKNTLNKLDLYSALALDDVLSAVPKWRGKVVECRLDSDAPDESYNDQDCLHRLETIASATIEEYKKQTKAPALKLKLD